MVGVCVALDEDARSAAVALGSVGPTILRAPQAEAIAAEALSRAGAWDDPRADLSPGELDAFGDAVASAARPIDDVRGTAAYRAHACRVLARRSLGWLLEDRRGGGGGC